MTRTEVSYLGGEHFNGGNGITEAECAGHAGEHPAHGGTQEGQAGWSRAKGSSKK